jgi:peptide/nickel transport system substrate-binding protein
MVATPVRTAVLLRVLSMVVLAVALCCGRPAMAEELVIGVRAGPLALDPHHAGAPQHIAAMRNIFDTLVRRSPRMAIEPNLAESWNRVDETTWEFRLRQGVLWHDSTPFTAADVKHSIERVPTVGTADGGVVAHVSAIIAVVILDEHTVRIRTDGPAPNLLADLDRVFIVQATPNTTLRAGDGAVGTGPYRYVSWEPGRELVLERFDEYWGDPKPHFTRVVFREIADDAARVAALAAGNVDLINHVPLSGLGPLRRLPQVQVLHVPSIFVFLLHPDGRPTSPLVTDHGGQRLAENPFRDVRVRRALSLAIDRSGLARTVMEGTATPAHAPLPPDSFGVPRNLGELRHDIVEARRLMTEAGYPRGFRVRLHCTRDRFPGDARICDALAPTFAPLGIVVDAVALPTLEYFTGFAGGDYSLAMNGWGTLTADATAMLALLLHTRGVEQGFGVFNRMRFSNAEIDRFARASLAAIDEAERRRLLEQGMSLAMELHAVIPIVTVPAIWAGNARRVTFIARMDEETLAIAARPPTR